MRAKVVPRLPPKRRRHVEGVVRTAERIAGGWGSADRDAALRAAWLHDAWRVESAEAMRAAIRAAGEIPDSWADRNAPVLLHAQAAAVWGRDALGERDPRVLLAVRHHPTAHPDWEDVGRALYCADYLEPGRDFHDADLASLSEHFPSDPQGTLREVARRRVSYAVLAGYPLGSETVAFLNSLCGDG